MYNSDSPLSHLLLRQCRYDLVALEGLFELFARQLSDLLQVFLEGEDVLLEGFLESSKAIIICVFFRCQFHDPVTIKKD